MAALLAAKSPCKQLLVWTALPTSVSLHSVLYFCICRPRQIMLSI